MTFDENERVPTQYHPSWFEGYRYVYPVVSRRSRGVSLGVNLSPTKLCNFRCVYCQVDRGENRAEIDRAIATTVPEQASSRDVLGRSHSCGGMVDLDVLESEILRLARASLDGELFKVERFAAVERSKRVLQDFAFSGDGEPTLAPQFPEAVSRLADARRRLGYDPLKLVLITNATRLERPEIARALDELCASNGEIWAKLDAGDPEWLRAVDRTAIPFETIVRNIEFAAKRWRVKIQTALFSWRGAGPTDEQFLRYCRRVREIMEAGGQVEAAQLYTVAREPAEPDAGPLPNDVMDRCAEVLRRETGLSVEVFYSR